MTVKLDEGIPFIVMNCSYVRIKSNSLLIRDKSFFIALKVIESNTFLIESIGRAGSCIVVWFKRVSYLPKILIVIGIFKNLVLIIEGVVRRPFIIDIRIRCFLSILSVAEFSGSFVCLLSFFKSS